MSSFAAQQPDGTDAVVGAGEAVDADDSATESTARVASQDVADTWIGSGPAGESNADDDLDSGGSGDVGGLGAGDSDDVSDSGAPDDSGDLGALDGLADRELAEHPDVYERIHAQLRGALAEIDDA